MLTDEQIKAIAGIIKEEIDPACLMAPDPCPDCMTAEHIAKRLANYFEKDNERFDREKFLSACGL